jgi:hypothetical protein
VRSVAFADKSHLVLVSGIGPLLDLDHFQILQNLKSVPTANEQDHIPRPQLSALQVGLIVIVKIHTHFSLFDEKCFLGVGDRAFHGLVHMGIDDLATRMLHKRQLLRKIIRREESDSWFAEIIADNDRQ